jgi:hypothetical protein
VPTSQQTDQPCAGFVFLVDSWLLCDTFRIRLTNEVEEMNKPEFAESMKGGYKLLLPRTDLELGYINGYRWGAVYENKGDEPLINDDVLIETYSTADDRWNAGPCSIWNFKARTITAFKITDERYKPADTSYLSVSEIPESKSNAESLSDWYDYESQKAVALPPVGEKVEVFLHWSESWSGWVVIVGHDHGGVIWRNGSDNKSYIYSSKDEIRPLDHATRKAEAEKKRVLDVFYSKWNERGDIQEVAECLYDAGFLRMPAE